MKFHLQAVFVNVWIFHLWEITIAVLIEFE